MINATPSQLRKAADIQERIQSLQEEFGQILGPAETAAAKTPRKGKMSAAGRAANRAAQKARWAKIKGTAPSLKPKKRKLSAQGLANIRTGVAKRMAAQRNAAKPARKRTMSHAAKAKMAALMKARWANAKKAGKAKL